MKYILLAGLVIIISTAIGYGFGNKSGGLIVGVVLAIMISKGIKNSSRKPPTEQ